MDSAIVLAGRYEKSFDLPISLIELEEGQRLIDRTLSILREVGISNIVIVTGFKSQLFCNISDVLLVCNENFVDTSSMASLALAAPFVTDDFLLIESEVLFERAFLTRLIECKGKNCLSIISESGTGDEAFVELEDGFVKKISKDIHQLFKVDGEMVGLSKISIHTFNQMLAKWASCDNKMMNYEYLLLDCVKLHELAAVKSPDLICYEVDNIKDLSYLKEKVFPVLCRKENPFDRQNIVEIFRQIMNIHDLPEFKTQIDQIGGMTNRNFKILWLNSSYVLRIPGNGTAEMLERRNEDYNSRLAYQIGIAPKILYLNIESGIKLTQYIENAETLNSATIQRLNNLEKVITNLKTLHTSGVRFNNDFNVFAEIQVYENLLVAANGSMYEGYFSLRPQVFALVEMLNHLGVILAPCHNDLVAENFVKSTDGKIFLIDWEYSGMNDPLWDLAALFLESDFTEENQQRSLILYFGDDIPTSIHTKILIYQVLMDVLWSIWTRIKEAQGDDFGSYGILRYQRAICNLSKLQTK